MSETPAQQPEASENKSTASSSQKKAATKLPSKPISFSGQQQSKKGQKGLKSNFSSSQKKGGVNLMRKLSGM
ncbi:MAG: hypothetical protein H7257_03380 [Taibaiella sp.]|nr:hypothetical protein [Taibaiella sp.]